MTWNIEKVKEYLSPRLEQGERILSVGLFRGGPSWWVLIFNYLLPLEQNYMAVTNKRLFVIPMNDAGIFLDEKVYSVLLTNAEIQGKNLFIRKTNEDKAKKYVRLGIPQLTGMNVQEFEDALLNNKSVSEKTKKIKS